MRYLPLSINRYGAARTHATTPSDNFSNYYVAEMAETRAHKKTHLPPFPKLDNHIRSGEHKSRIEQELRWIELSKQ